MIDKKIIVQFTALTFLIAYPMAGITIVLGHSGLIVQSSAQAMFQSFKHLLPNIPFTIYILSPAISSFIVLKKNNKIANFKEWSKSVFYVKNSILLYLFIAVGLVLYFFMHFVMAGYSETALPFYMFLLALPGNLIIGGFEEAGWSYILQPELAKKYGFTISSIFTGLIWVLWHVPLFCIEGTSHGEGLINFWMFAIQLMAFRFFYGAIQKISGKGSVFMCVLFHTMFNAANYAFGISTTTWAGTIVANVIIVVISITTVILYDKKKKITL